MNDQTSYVASVAALYAELPDTPLSASASDQWLARRLFDEGVPLRIVEMALLLGSLRRIARPTGAPALQPIRSLAYFRPVVDELQSQQVPDGYLEYLRLKLNKAVSTLAGRCSKSYVSS
jgi:hypothetical protein